MTHEIAEYFSDGYSTPEMRAIFPEKGETVNVAEYLARVVTFIRGVADFAAYVVLQVKIDDDIRAEFLPTAQQIPTRKSVATATRPSKVYDIAPYISAIGLDSQVTSEFEQANQKRMQMNAELKRKFRGFDFEKAALSVEELLYTVKTSVRGLIDKEQEKIIRGGANVLIEAQNIHEAIESIYIYAEVGAQHYYSDVAKIINVPWNGVINHLEARVELWSDTAPPKEWVR